MKKIKNFIIFIFFISTLITVTACSWNDIERFISKESGVTYNATSIEDLSGNQAYSLLLSTRNKIRQFNVYIESNLYNISFMGKTDETTNLGSGSIIARSLDFKTYYVLTNYHVITSEGYSHVSYTIETESSSEYTATLIYKDIERDMAILSFSTLEELSIANLTERLDTSLTVDEFLLAVGNPSGVKNIVTFGKYLGLEKIANVSYNVIHHNVLINPGNSGGALTDINGNVIGVNTWGTEGDDENNYAIPLSEIKTFIISVQSNIAGFPTIF